ncbi:MAG: GntR family transcriptional regulator [Lewinellaceae bacterium]|nr:GntR family transcriptional regulator [Saprospiraceae bacterium]MCB9339475.1 GntR family transcriptional regulator [Lewinellaceae bacterium]
MIELGKYNRLRAVRQTDNGVYLTDQEASREVLLPNKFIPDGLYEDDILKVFVFKDSEDRITATTMKPKIMLGEFALLQVRDVNNYGAFLDWGMDKDLLVPFKEQPGRMSPGNWYMVHLYLDRETERLVASGRYQKFLQKDNIDLRDGQQVNLLIDDRTDLGVNAIINHRYRGLLYENEIFEKINRGDLKKGYVKKVREDGKVDVTLQPLGYAKVEPNAVRILEQLRANKGFLPLTDKSDPEVIAEMLAMSKKTYKKAVGALYRERLVRLEPDGIYLVGEKENRLGSNKHR